MFKFPLKKLQTVFFSCQSLITATNRNFWLVAMTNGYQLVILVIKTFFGQNGSCKPPKRHKSEQIWPKKRCSSTKFSSWQLLVRATNKNFRLVAVSHDYQLKIQLVARSYGMFEIFSKKHLILCLLQEKKLDKTRQDKIYSTQ